MHKITNGVCCSGTPADIVEAEEHEAFMNKLYVAEAEGLKMEKTVVPAGADSNQNTAPSLAHSKARL